MSCFYFTVNLYYYYIMGSYSGMFIKGNTIMHASGLSHIFVIDITNYPYEHDREVNIGEDGIEQDN